MPEIRYWYNPTIKEVKLLTRLWLGVNHLHENNFKRSFPDPLNPLCSCRKVKTTFHFLISCPNYFDKRLTLLSKIRNINPSSLENTNSEITKFFLIIYIIYILYIYIYIYIYMYVYAYIYIYIYNTYFAYVSL